MLSVSGIDWEEKPINRRIIEKVNIENNFSEIISKIIISRNFDQIEIESLKGNTEIYNPFIKEKDFISGLKILNTSIIKKERILIIGDYDVDGCVSTSLLFNFLKKLSKNIYYYIPDRIKDGYGPTLSLVKKLLKKKTRLDNNG